MRKIIRIFDSFAALICVIIFSFVIWGSAALPDKYVSYSESLNEIKEVYSFSDNEKTQAVDFQNNSSRNQTLKLFNLIPVKSVAVSKSEERKVYVSGEAFGIKLYTDGVIVVGTQAVDTEGGKVNPAKEAGIEVGDIIISINNMNVFSSDEVAAILNDNNGKPYKIKLKRKGRHKTFTLKPVYSDREGCYKAGMWVRDSTAGIGTLTYYDKKTGVFGALGHQVNDVDTNEIMPMLEGEAVCAEVTKVQKASSGVTGSLVCDFKDRTMGKLIANSQGGLYGVYSYISDNAYQVPVASKQEVKIGKAQILTTVDSGKPKLYDVEITRVSYSENNQSKNIIFRIKDKELIKKTGGVVQGMSGSPVLQNGKLVGAVTHVVVNNPEKGYAVFAQSMLEKSDSFVE